MVFYGFSSLILWGKDFIREENIHGATSTTLIRRCRISCHGQADQKRGCFSFFSQVTHFLNTSYLNWFKAKYKVAGAVFQGRYKSIFVEEETHALELSASVHLNPIRTKLTRSLRGYRWSSFLDYVHLRTPDVVSLDPTIVLSKINRNVERSGNLISDERTKIWQEAGLQYEDFVLSHAENKNPFDKAYTGHILGSVGFVEKVKKQIVQMGEHRKTIRTENSWQHHDSGASQQSRNKIET